MRYETLSLTARGDLLIYEPSSESYRQKAAHNVSSTDIYAHLLVTGNKIYIKDEETLTCWEVN